MPLVNVKLIEGVFTHAQKARIIADLTEAMVRIEGENLRPVTWVVIDEVASGEWGIGGKAVTADEVLSRAIRAQGSSVDLPFLSTPESSHS